MFSRTSGRETSERHLGDNLKTSERHLGCIRHLGRHLGRHLVGIRHLGRHLRGIWAGSGRQLGGTWEASERQGARGGPEVDLERKCAKTYVFFCLKWRGRPLRAGGSDVTLTKYDKYHQLSTGALPQRTRARIH